MPLHSRTRTMNLTIATVAASIMLQVGFARSNIVTMPLPPQPLADALDSFAQRTGLQLIYSAALAKNVMSQGAAGGQSAEQVLRDLLRGTGLTFEFVNDRTVTLMPPATAPRAPADVSTGSKPNVSSAPSSAAPAADSKERTGFWSRLQAFRLAQANDVSQPDAAIAGNRKAGGATEVETVTVTGSRLTRTSVEGPVPVNVYSRDDIERSGQTTVTDFLNSLPEVSTAHPENGNVGFGQTTVALRGLPNGTTLMLINGRRMEVGGTTVGSGGYFDLNNIPAAVVERIEIVPEGSSAVYGSDALAGVVNIILKKEFDGIEADARYGAASGIDESSADFAWGGKWARGSASLIGSYYTRGRLNGTERDITLNNSGAAVQSCAPGNVYSTDGSNLPGLGAPSAGVRAGEHAAPSAGDFVGGVLNGCRQYSDRDLIPPANRKSVMASGNYALTSHVELFTELMYTRQDLDFIQLRKQLTNVLVPASNAFNPFGKDVRVSYRFSALAGESNIATDTDFSRLLAGARGALGHWDWELAAWEARDSADIFVRANNTNGANLAAALASSNPGTALNLFTSGAPASDAVLASIYSPVLQETRGRSQVANGFIRGALFDLPAGPVNAVVGAEYSRSLASWGYPSANTGFVGSSYDYRRKSSSVFSELRLPILASHGEPGAGDTLAVTTAVRYDRYDDFGGHTTPQYAVEWRPTGTLLLRGSYAKAFKAPGLIYLNYPFNSYSNICCVSDPRRGGVSGNYGYTFSGNPDLKPETGQSHSLGLAWSPRQLEGLEAQLNWWQINQVGRVTNLNAQTIVNNESLFPGRVQRDPQTGAIQVIDTSFLNFGELNASGFDLGVSHRFRTALGTFTSRVSATSMYEYRAAVTPGAPVVDRLSKATQDAWAPRWKGAVSLGWASGPYSAFASGRYTGSYTDYQDAGPTTRELGDFWLFDLTGKYDLGRWIGGKRTGLSDSFVQLSVLNVFNSLPEYSAFLRGEHGYDAAQYDIRGRFISAAVGVRF
ncbi:MAG: TonB-dependent receptor [Gammaproteobacteria bacterium]